MLFLRVNQAVIGLGWCIIKGSKVQILRIQGFKCIAFKVGSHPNRKS